ncbi:LOW QUALITY PROTEIN: uncharacterized protein LOC121952752 [Plectropomus leopardus]|uniref:LOW QUALITY PROTEIN: uncharacterized protein LOC121952752 n=1 Tax=Plectropomus leopardus TaxID=160734 RepID=UPI001C4A8EA9|nr:LOW QUALITY PROTEIN: uncharacterized protein LOC121952752 [Plectropomus leopardus]
MPLKLPPTSNGPMDKFVKKTTTNQNGESSQTPSLHRAGERCVKQATAPGCNPPLTKSQQRSAPVPRDAPDTQEQEPHATHSFEWCWSDKKATTFTCNKAGTVEDLLKRSSQFLEIAGKNHNKELVIVRDGKAISSHFPCSLIKNERLNIKYIKAVSELQQPVSGSVHRQRKGLSGEPVMFHVLTKGGKKVVNIMRNRALQKDIQEVTVYAFKDEKVKHALRRDGRFIKTLFKKNIALSNLSTEVTTEMSDFVDDLDGKHFKIILLNKSNPPESQESLEDAYMMQNEPQTSDCNGNPDPSKRSTTTESVNDNVPKKKPKLDGNMAPGNMLREIPNSKKILCQLSSQFQELVKGEKTQQGSKLSRIQNIFRVKFGKNAQTCREVKTMKKLMALSDSVCQVRVNDTPAGSGFLLFGRCVLTNAHVVQNIYNESTGQLNETVTVHFSFESLNQTPSGASSEGGKILHHPLFSLSCKNQPMNQPLKTKNSGPMDKAIKPCDKQATAPGCNPPLTESQQSPTLNTVFDEITVFAYKDEKVKHALKRNGRFQDVVFTKICALLNKNIEAITSMHSLVNNLDGKYFKIILLNKSDCDENPDPSKWSTITESVNDNIPPKLDGNMVLDKKSHEIPNFKEMMHQLSSQFKDLIISKEPQESKLSCIQTFFCVKCEIPNSEEIMHQLFSQFFPDFMKSNKPQQSKLSCNQNISHVEFGKNREVKTNKLMALSDSVCQVRVNDKPAGSGFLLFGRYVLTNAHVVQNIYNESTGQLNETVTVDFSFKSLNQMQSGAVVKEVAGFEFGPDASGHECDWALLRLAADQKLPGALLKHYGFLPQSGLIYIIGHPDGGVKKIDECPIVSIENRIYVVERHYYENPAGVLPEDNRYSENRGHIQLVTNQFFEDVAKDVNLNRQALTYKSCFYFGSSGSPVFDEHCNVIAVHSGGYAYRNVRGEMQSVIEYGHPLSLIIEHIIVQMVEKGRFDVLKEYLACDYARHPNTMSSLKKLVESRNLTAFKNAVNNLPSTSDESLKTFFEFFSQTEAPVPMEID